MHTTVRRYIKTGVAFLAAGLLSGLYMVVRREVTGRWPSPYLVAAHTHVLLVGFMMFMILGVALWIFPRPEGTTPAIGRAWSIWPTGCSWAGRQGGSSVRWPGCPLKRSCSDGWS